MTDFERDLILYLGLLVLVVVLIAPWDPSWRDHGGAVAPDDGSAPQGDERPWPPLPPMH